MADLEVVTYDISMNHQIGNFHLLFTNKRIIGPNYISVSILFLFNVVTSAAIIAYILPLYMSNTVFIFLELVIFSTTLYSGYLFCDWALSDPGIIPKSKKKVDQGITYFVQLNNRSKEIMKLTTCNKWNIIQPPRWYHCDAWNVWIEMHSHHWNWIGGCIGIRNSLKLLLFFASSIVHWILWFLITFAPTNYYYDLAFSRNNYRYSIQTIAMILLLVILMVAWLLLVVLGVLHFDRARKNLTCTEIENQIYKRKSNPFDFGARKNLYNFFYKYPNSPSNLFDSSKSFFADERSYYFSILGRYGKVVYTKMGLNIEDLYNRSVNLSNSDPFESKVSHRNATAPKNLDSLFMHRLSFKPNSYNSVLSSNS